MLTVKKLTVGQMSTNCYILNDETAAPSEAVVIDPGECFDLIDRYLKSKMLIPKHIILTHAHFDHIGAVNQLVEKYNSTIIMNENDHPLLKDPMLNLSCGFDGAKTVIDCQNIKFVNNDTNMLLGHDFSYIPTPGHTPGSMCIKVSDKIFTGDTLFYCSVGNAFPPYGNTEQEINSIKLNLYSLAGDYVCYPGHGCETSLVFEKNNNPYTGDYYSGY